MKEELVEEEQLVVKEGRKNLDGGRGGSGSGVGGGCSAQLRRGGGYFIPPNIPLHCWASAQIC